MVRRCRVVSSGAYETYRRNFGKYGEFASNIDEPDTGTVKVVPAPSRISPTWQIRDELPIPLCSFRDDETDRKIDEWRNS